MKSYINILADYHKTPLEKDITIRCPEEHIQSQMRHLTRNHKKTEPVSVMQEGDVVVLALESENPKFNRPMIPINIGGGLFDAAFEAALIGHSTAEPFTVTVQSKTVKVTVKQATRTVFPEPTDEMAAAYAAEHDELKDISTVEEYRQRIVDDYMEEQHRQVFFKAMDDVLGYVLTHSDWMFDKEEITALIQEETGFINQQLREDHKEALDYLSDDELSRYFGVASRKEMDKIIENGAEQRIATALWNAAVNGMEAEKASLEELENDADWSFLENFVKENLTIKEEM